jgi:hypothetical protein
MNNQQVLLRRRPQGEPRPEDFEVVERSAPVPGLGRCWCAPASSASTPTCAAG